MIWEANIMIIPVSVKNQSIDSSESQVITKLL